jgi:transcriptional regulator with PAS, ATPase and Fis domain
MKSNSKPNPPEESYLGESKQTLSIREKIKSAAAHDYTVLIEGPNGTGKEIIAKAIHHGSPRKYKKLVLLNCGAIPAELFESELFGYKRGAFTGAISDKKGAVSGAEGGTLFLDEIGDLKPHHQAAILRFLESKEYSRVGLMGDQLVADVRIIAATNKNLDKMIARGEFREDLYYRLNESSIQTEPLESRPVDIIYFVNHFSHAQKITVSPKSKFLLYSYNFPGNVRELKSLLRLEYNEIRERIMKTWEVSEAEIGAIDFDNTEVDISFMRRSALSLVDRIPEECIERCVIAYEILSLTQKCGLSKDRTAEVLHRGRVNTSGSGFEDRLGYPLRPETDGYIFESPFHLLCGPEHLSPPSLNFIKYCQNEHQTFKSPQSTLWTMKIHNLLACVKFWESLQPVPPIIKKIFG